MMDQEIGKSLGAEIAFSLPESNQRQLFFIRSSSPDIDLSALMRPRQRGIALDEGD
jgi:hypothetical protein